MQELHEEHPSIVAMKAIGRSYMWRPNVIPNQWGKRFQVHPCIRAGCLLECGRVYTLTW